MTDKPISPNSTWARLAIFARDIKLSHTIFAMPFALLATFMAAGAAGTIPAAGQLLLIVICMVLGRTIAMGSNRLLDAKLDALNIRTRGRAIPSGALSPQFVRAILVACSAGFIVTTAGFWVLYNNRWPLILAIPVLLAITIYPLLKRFTRLCHYYLGAALALAPIAAWIAINPWALDWSPFIMGGAVLMWTAGFDVIYACQDYRSDLETGVHSLPASVGIGQALWIARLTHIAAALLLGLLWWYSPLLGTFYLAGAGVAAALLILEHALVSERDLSKVGIAFFTINGLISLTLGILGILDVLRLKGM